MRLELAAEIGELRAHKTGPMCVRFAHTADGEVVVAPGRRLPVLGRWAAAALVGLTLAGGQAAADSTPPRDGDPAQARPKRKTKKVREADKPKPPAQRSEDDSVGILDISNLP